MTRLLKKVGMLLMHWLQRRLQPKMDFATAVLQKIAELKDELLLMEELDGHLHSCHEGSAADMTLKEHLLDNWIERWTLKYVRMALALGDLQYEDPCKKALDELHLLVKEKWEGLMPTHTNIEVVQDRMDAMWKNFPNPPLLIWNRSLAKIISQNNDREMAEVKKMFTAAKP